MMLAPRQLATFTRRLSDLIGGGLSMRKSLAVLSAQSENRNVRALLKSLHAELENGKSFSDALRGQNGTFGPIYTGLVRSGESSGRMEATLEELASLLEADVETGQRIRSALAYPVALLALSFGVCFFLALFVVPRFELLFQDLGQRLPWPTRFLMALTSAIKTFGWYLVPVAAMVGTFCFKRKRWQERVIESFFHVPYVFALIRNVNLHRWTRAMASLLRGGVPAPEALWLSRQTVSPLLFGGPIKNAIARLRDGKSLSSALGASAVFPPMLCEMIGAAEESGRLEQTFERLAESYKRESESAIKMALSLLEPALVLAMGVVVGFVAVAMLLPIFEMSANLR